MDLSNDSQRKLFMQLHAGLPRQSCGSERSTLRALQIIRQRLPVAASIADLGCGSGASVLPLAHAMPTANFLAVDLYPPFIQELLVRAENAGVLDRIDARVGDMLTPPTNRRSIDLIWCEGAIYNVGIAHALRQWAEYLKPGGLVVFNEPIWLTPDSDRPAPITEFWSAYPSMTDDAGVRTAIASAGYTRIDQFDMPEADWWDAYYDPLEAKLHALEKQHKSAPPLEHTRTEIAMRRQHAAHYNYRFYCVSRTD